MRDYSNYHTNSKDKIVADGKRLLGISADTSIEIDGQIVDADVNDKYSDSETLKNVISDLSAFKSGSVVVYEGNYWLTTSLNDNGIYKKGVVKLCPSTLKWLNSSGEVKETPFTLKTSPSSAYNLQDDKIMILSKERRNILIQANADTKQIKKDKRFIFDERAWKVVGFNGLTEGILELTLEEDLIDAAKDNVDFRIADYVGNAANYSITILNGESFSIRAGHTLQLSVEVKNNGVVIDKPVLFSSSDETIATISSTGLVTGVANGSVVITATLQDAPSVSDTTNVTIELDTVDYYTVSILDVSPINVNSSKIFTAQVKNNGIVDNTKFVHWYLYADDGVSSTTLATVTMDTTTQCTIKGNSVGYVKLRCEVIGVSSAYVVERIQIKTLL